MRVKRSDERPYSKKRSIAALAVLITSLNGCGEQPLHLTANALSQQLEQTIINGQRCVENEYPSSLEILVDATIDFGPWGGYQLVGEICGGTLIAPDVVLTAAHCMDANSLTNGLGKVKSVSYYVTSEANLSSMATSGDPKIPANAVLVKSFSVHQEYNSETFEGGGLNQHRDIGILFLSKPLDIEPALVMTKEESAALKQGKDVAIVGWGQQTPEESGMGAPNPNQGYKMCALSTINELGPYEMQIGSDQNSKRKCYGDSGGATYLTLTGAIGNPARLIGITSHAYDINACNKGGVDTRVDAYLDWIDGKMREGCESGSRVWCEEKGIIKPPVPGSGIKAVARRLWEIVVSWIYG